MIRMFDLAGADPALRFSPYCWRTRFALAHKGLEVETLPWRFTEKDRLPEGQSKVPVILDGDRVVADSWTIAEYLEDRWPERPTLFGGPAGRAHARFLNAWADQVLMPGLVRLVLRDVWTCLDPRDRDYFRRSREQRLGMTLEQVQEGREERVDAFRALLAPMRTVLRVQPFLGGEEPSYADHIVAGTLQWPRCTSRFEVLAPDDAVAGWLERVLGLYGGLGRAAQRA